MIVRDFPLRLRDHRRCGNRRKCCENASASASAETTTPHGSFHNASRPASGSRRALLQASASSPGYGIPLEAQPNLFLSAHSVQYLLSCVLGDNSRLNIVRAVHQLAEDLIKTGKRRATGDVFAGIEFAAGDKLKSFTGRGRSVMKARLQRNVVVVQSVRVQLDFCA